MKRKNKSLIKTEDPFKFEPLNIDWTPIDQTYEPIDQTFEPFEWDGIKVDWNSECLGIDWASMIKKMKSEIKDKKTKE